jgi:hypothetical protein
LKSTNVKVEMLFRQKHQEMIFLPEPKIMKMAQPKMQTRAVWLKTEDQLCVDCKIYPATYTPTNPGIAPAVFIIPGKETTRQKLKSITTKARNKRYIPNTEPAYLGAIS